MKIGTVPYFNTLPLTHFLNAEIVKAAPCAMQDILDSENVDVALMPIGATLNKNYYLYPECGVIGCDGTVGSVGFFTKPWIASLRQVQRVAWDSDSKSSNLLGKIILKWEAETNIKSSQIDPDAELLIGDKALFNKSEKTYWDLGERWKHHTDLGFIFACWASKMPLSDHQKAILSKARDTGCSHVDTILAQVPKDKSARLKKYFSEQIQYRATPTLLMGLERFRSEVKNS